MDPASDFIPLSEAAVLLREPPITLYHRVIRGELEGTRSGRAWMVPRAAVEALLADAPYLMTSQEFAGRLARAFRVYQARINEDVEQAELGRRVAARLGRADAFSQGAVSRWFSGSEPRYAVVRAIAEELGVTPAWLAFGEATPSERETLDRAARDLGDVKEGGPAAPADPVRRGKAG